MSLLSNSRPMRCFISGIVGGAIIAALEQWNSVFTGAMLGGLVGGLVGGLAVVGQWRETHHPELRLIVSALSIPGYFLCIKPFVSAWLGTNTLPPNQDAMVIEFLIITVWTAVALIIAIDAAVWLLFRSWRSSNEKH